jgi:hypothetical protein
MRERNFYVDDAKDRGNGKSVAVKARPAEGWGVGGERSLLGYWENFPGKNQSLAPKQQWVSLGKPSPSSSLFALIQCR